MDMFTGAVNSMQEDVHLSGETAVERGKAQGHIERIDNGILYGWFWNPERGTSKNVRIEIDGVWAGLARATLFREDLANAKIGNGHHGFRFPIPLIWRDGASHHFTLKPDRNSLNSIYATATLNPGTQQHSFEGQIERFSDGFVHGWACDHVRPETRLRITALVEGRPVGSAVADRQRDDLIDVGFGDGRYAFRLPLNVAALTSSGAIELIFVADDGDNRYETGRMTFAPPLTSFDAPRPAEAVKAPVAAIPKHSLAQPAALSKLRSLPTSGFYLHAKHRSDADRCHIYLDGNSLNIHLETPQGWIRLLHTLPHAQDLVQNDWQIQLKFFTPAQFGFSVNLIDYHDSGQFRVIRRIAKDCIGSSGANEFDFSIKARHLRAEGLNQATSPVFIAFETSTSFNLEALQVSVEAFEVCEDSIPYRNSESASSVLLAQINDSLASFGKRQTSKWMLDMADAAIRLECFETASGLLRNINIRTLADKSLRRQYLLTFAEVAFAEGKIAELRNVMLECKDIVLNDDRLFSSLSLCFPATDHLVEFFGVLPSGKTNRFYIARCNLNSSALKSMLTNPKEYDDGQSHLLMAKLTKSLGVESYLHHWNSVSRQNSVSRG